MMSTSVSIIRILILVCIFVGLAFSLIAIPIFAVKMQSNGDDSYLAFINLIGDGLAVLNISTAIMCLCPSNRSCHCSAPQDHLANLMSSLVPVFTK